MTTPPDLDENKDFDILLRLSGDNQNRIMKEGSSFDTDKIGCIKPTDSIIVKVKPKLEPETKRSSRNDAKSLSRISEYTLETVQPKCGSNDNMNDSSSVGSFAKRMYVQKQDEGHLDRISPKNFEQSSTDAEKVESELQKSISDHCESKNAVEIPGAEIIKALQIQEATVEAGNVSQVKQSEKRECDSKSSGNLDLEISCLKEGTDKETKHVSIERKNLNIPSPGICQSRYMSVFHQKDEKKRSDLKAVGGEEETQKKLSHEQALRLDVMLLEPSSSILSTESQHASTNSAIEVSNHFFEFERLQPPIKVRNSIENDAGGGLSNNSTLKESCIENRMDTTILPTRQHSPLHKNDLDSKRCFSSPKLINQTKIRRDRTEEQKSKAPIIDKSHNCRSDMRNHLDGMNSKLSKQNSLLCHNPDYNDITESSSKQCVGDEISDSPLMNSSDLLTKNQSEPDTLEELLHYNPSLTKLEANLPFDDHLNPRIECLQGSLPFQIQSNKASDVQIQLFTEQHREFKCFENSFLSSVSSGLDLHTNFDDYKTDHEIQADSEEISESNQLEDLSLGVTPSTIQSNLTLDHHVLSKNDETPVDSERNLKLRRPENLRSGPAPIQSNNILKNKLSNKVNDIQMDTEISVPLLPSITRSALPRKTVSTANKNTYHPEEGSRSIPMNPFGNYVTPIHDSIPDLSHETQSVETSKISSVAEHKNNKDFNEEGQLSVFSDATSGQVYLQHVSNAKEKLKKIEYEMIELGRKPDDCEKRIIDNNDTNRCDHKSAILPFEKNDSIESIRSKIASKCNPKNQKERKMEHHSRKQQRIFENSSNFDRKEIKLMKNEAENNQVGPKKGRKKDPSSNFDGREKNTIQDSVRVGPKKGRKKDPMDPDGQEISHRTFSHGKMEESSPRTDVKWVVRDKSPTSIGIKSTARDRNYCDPPMVIRGSLKIEGSPNESDRDRLSIDMRTKRKQKHPEHGNRGGKETRDRIVDRSNCKGCFQEDLERCMDGVVSSCMERGDAGWRISIDDVNAGDITMKDNSAKEEDSIDGIPRHVDTNKPNLQQQYDPWEEIPCSFCCRYLPHTLVAATTHAYRLDRADEKDNELKDSKH